MKRRGFLKKVSALTLVSATPAIVSGKDKGDAFDKINKDFTIRVKWTARDDGYSNPSELFDWTIMGFLHSELAERNTPYAPRETWYGKIKEGTNGDMVWWNMVTDEEIPSSKEWMVTSEGTRMYIREYDLRLEKEDDFALDTYFYHMDAWGLSPEEAAKKAVIDLQSCIMDDMNDMILEDPIWQVWFNKIVAELIPVYGERYIVKVS